MSYAMLKGKKLVARYKLLTRYIEALFRRDQKKRRFTRWEILASFTPVVLKVVDIGPKGSIGPSKGTINSHGLEWRSMNGQGFNE